METRQRIDFLYLSEQDMLKSGVSDMPKCISAMEEVFRLLHSGDYRMGGPRANEHGIRVIFPNESIVPGLPLNKPDFRFVAMPAYLGGRFRSFGIKTYGSNPDNRELGLPRSILMFSLMDAVTGAPMAYMSANILSAMRTAAVTGLGVKWFCRKDARVLSIIGPGVMGRYALDAFMACDFKFEALKVKGRGAASLKKFIEYVKAKHPEIKSIDVCDSVVDACKGSDVVYFGTTNAARFEDNPTIKKDWIKPGCVVISASALLVGPETLRACTLVADNYAMYEGWGIGNPYPTQKSVSSLLGMGFYDAICQKAIKREDVYDLGDVISNKKNLRKSDDQIFMYSVGGMPVEDVAWANEVYHSALRQGIGVMLNLWDQPELMK